MFSLQDSENCFHYDYANSSSDSSDTSDYSSDGAFELLRRANRTLPPVDQNIFTIAGIRDNRKDISGAKPIREGEEESRREKGEVKALPREGGENFEIRHQSQVGVSSSAQPSVHRIDLETIASLSAQVAQAYEETCKQEKELRRTGQLIMAPQPRRSGRKRELPTTQ